MGPIEADQAGPLLFRVEFPVGAGRIFAWIVFPLVAAPILFFLVQVLRAPDVAIGFLALVAAGFLLTMRSLGRRPTALEVRERSLLLVFGSHAEAVDWSEVKGVEQTIVGMVPTYVLLFKSRRKLLFGAGARAEELAQQIVRKAGLRWLHEPFSARRPA